MTRRSFLRPMGLAIALAALSAIATPLLAGEAWPVPTPSPVRAVVQEVDDVFIRHGGGWRRLVACGEGEICEAAGAPRAPRRAADGIPHGRIVAAAGRGPVNAWYTDPTRRYGHAVLGDRIEGGALAVEDDLGRRYELALPDRFVFEDLTPRIADLDNDGVNEVVAIRSDVRKGAAIVVYGLRDGALVERAAIPPIGLANRWLNVAGIADYTGDGRPDIAIVKTPHIGGRLEFWTLTGQGLVRQARATGFSNHAIGSTELGLSASADFNRDGVVDLVLPDAARASLRFISVAGGTVRELASVELPGRVETALGVVTGASTGGGDPVVIAGLRGGELVAIRP